MARYRKQSLAAAKLKVSTGERSKRQTVVHLLTAVNWAWPLFPFPSVPIPPWAILLPSRASFRINCPPQQKLLLPCAWLRTSLSNTNSNFPFNFLSQSPALSNPATETISSFSFPFIVPLHDCCHLLHSPVLNQQIVIFQQLLLLFSHTFCNLCH